MLFLMQVPIAKESHSVPDSQDNCQRCCANMTSECNQSLAFFSPRSPVDMSNTQPHWTTIRNMNEKQLVDGNELSALSLAFVWELWHFISQKRNKMSCSVKHTAILIIILFVKHLISSYTVLSFVLFHPFSHPMIQGSAPPPKKSNK